MREERGVKKEEEGEGGRGGVREGEGGSEGRREAG